MKKNAGEQEAGEEGKECGGTRFLQKAGFPRTPSGKNSNMAGGRVKAMQIIRDRSV